MVLDIYVTRCTQSNYINSLDFKDNMHFINLYSAYYRLVFGSKACLLAVNALPRTKLEHRGSPNYI